jgi:hypothetical protein
MKLFVASFYNAWELHADGTPPVTDLNAEAHAQIYWELVRSSEQGHYDIIFVKGENGAKATIQNDLKPILPW